MRGGELRHMVRASFGEFLVCADGAGALLSVRPFPPGAAPEASDRFPAGSRAEEALRALRGYLDSPRGLDPRVWSGEPCLATGSAFQRQVWGALAGIGCGSTVTYGELAARIGRPGASRAVAGAVGSNPLAVLLPCHRVVGSGGRLTGFCHSRDAGFLAVKQGLLDLEGAAELRWWY